MSSLRKKLKAGLGYDPIVNKIGAVSYTHLVSFLEYAVECSLTVESCPDTDVENRMVAVKQETTEMCIRDRQMRSTRLSFTSIP